jgi:deazaflavin-dependent oxidoreductase (nitroreductase family)
MPLNLRSLADEDFCYLTTRGRVTGQPRTIEIWFALQGQTLYLLAGEGRNAGWVKNLLRAPAVSVRIGKALFTGSARVVEQADEDALARQCVVGKYQPRESEDLSLWGKTALPVAVALTSDNDS